MALAKPKKLKLAPIESETVVKLVIDRITSAIINGQFKIGEKLPSEYELIDELHVSRNSLREAMKILSAMGVVDIKRGDGTYICSQINPNMFDSVIYSLIFESSSQNEIVELRHTFDEIVLKLAIKNGTKEEIEQLEAYTEGMRKHFENGNISEAAKLDYEFHIYLTDMSKNSFISRIVKGIYKLFEQSIEENIKSEEMFAQADEHHQDIIECIKEKDFSKVEEVVASSLSTWRKNVRIEDR